jgi:hypothetical protein
MTKKDKEKNWVLVAFISETLLEMFDGRCSMFDNRCSRAGLKPDAGDKSVKEAVSNHKDTAIFDLPSNIGHRPSNPLVCIGIPWEQPVKQAVFFRDQPYLFVIHYHLVRVPWRKINRLFHLFDLIVIA